VSQIDCKEKKSQSNDCTVNVSTFTVHLCKNNKANNHSKIQQQQTNWTQS